MELKKLGLLLAKAETTYGTDPTPTSGANVIAVTRNEVTLDITGETLDRDLLDGGFTRVQGVQSMPRANIKFRTELRGNRTTGAQDTDISDGTSTYKVEIDPLLQACDLEPTYTAESGAGLRDGMAIYKPTIPTAGTAGDSVTFYFYSQQKLYKLLGAKGNIENIGFEAGKFAYIDWSFDGLYVAPSDSSIPASPTFLDTKPPILTMPIVDADGSVAAGAPYHNAVSVTADATANTFALNSHGLFNGDRVKFGGSAVPSGLTSGTWYYVVNTDWSADTFKVASTLGGSAIDITTAGTSVTMTSAPAILFNTWNGAVFRSANFKLGNAISMREDGNYTDGIRGFCVTDRASAFDFDPESVAEATHPFWSDWYSRTAKTLSLRMGRYSGNRVGLELTLGQDRITYADSNGKRIMQVSCSVLNPTVGTSYGSDFKLIFQ